jgi:6,7-dimethyl-8-ribityllumazine synthase
MNENEDVPAAGLPRIAVVVSRYNATVTDRLLAGAVRAYTRAGGSVRDLYIAEAPGSFEIVALAAAAAQSRMFAGVLAIGCIIKGETRHDEFLGHAVTKGLADLAFWSSTSGPVIPVGLAVLTVNTPAQAVARAGGAGGGKFGNKGEEAMAALLQTVGEVAALSDEGRVEGALASGVMAARIMRAGGAGGAGGADGSGSPDKVRGAVKGGRSGKRRGPRGGR